jgi:hypothetical protein
MWWIQIKCNINITAGMEDRHHQNFMTLSFQRGVIFKLQSCGLWNHSLTGNKCSKTLISRYRIPEHESVAHIHLPGKCVSKSCKTNEGWTYHKQYAPKRRQQCWLLSPTSILGCLLMMQNRGWLEFVHNKACQEQRKPPIGLMADPASSHMLVFPILCFMVQWSSTSNSLNETTI